MKGAMLMGQLLQQQTNTKQIACQISGKQITPFPGAP